MEESWRFRLAGTADGVNGVVATVKSFVELGGPNESAPLIAVLPVVFRLLFLAPFSVMESVVFVVENIPVIKNTKMALAYHSVRLIKVLMCVCV